MKRFDKVLYEMLKRDRALIFLLLYRHSISFSKAIYYTDDGPDDGRNTTTFAQLVTLPKFPPKNHFSKQNLTLK